MSDSYSNFDAWLAADRAARNPSNQPTASGMADADTRKILDIIFPPAALMPGGQQDFTKQVLSPVMPAISGVTGGITGGLANGFQGAWDGARAGWQAQTEAQNAYAAQNPGTAALADLISPLGAAKELGYAEDLGALASDALPGLTKKILSDPASAQALASAQQDAIGAANLSDWMGQGEDLSKMGHALWQYLSPGNSPPAQASTAPQSLPDPTELPRLPGSPPPISSGPPSWVPMLSPPDATAPAVNLTTPDYLKPGWSYSGPQVESPVNLVPGMTVTGDYGGGSDDEDEDEDEN